ncbi:MAG: UDP-N-acetylmuramate dehydrogenase [Gallionellaceae bacterium]
MSEPTQFSEKGLRGEMRHDVDMSRYTSWRAGGIAQRMYRPADLADLQLFLSLLPAEESLVAIGLGSNLLIRDGGLRGTVLLMHGALSEMHMDGDYVYAQAGVPGAKLARFAAANELHGAGFFAGIPGTLGGMLAMNAGCYGSETWDKVVRVQVMTRNGELQMRTPQDYQVSYRHASRNRDAKCDIQDSVGQEFFVSAWLKFDQGESEVAKLDIKALLEKRSASQPLHLPNAGSVFRNPQGNHAARLIESCGLKGLRIGGAQVSQKHANFIVNIANASATDIENLIEQVRATVAEKTGVKLQPEVKIIGEKLA